MRDETRAEESADENIGICAQHIDRVNDEALGLFKETPDSSPDHNLQKLTQAKQPCLHIASHALSFSMD
jgi:hypothetical protein